MAGKLLGKVAVVAGGSSGIGRAIAIEYAKEGAKVLIADIVEKPGWVSESTSSVINSKGGTAVYAETDVSSENSVKMMVDRAVKSFGGIDILVNSAGISLNKSISDTTSEDFDKMYSVTVKGSFLTIKYCLPSILKSSNGKIINVASNFSFTALPRMSAYASSKAAIIGLTKSLALELGPSGVNVNVICPGATKTEMSRPYWGTPEGVEFLKARIPLRKGEKFVADPEDVAKIAAFLASDDSNMITGESVLIDSGWNAF